LFLPLALFGARGIFFVKYRLVVTGVKDFGGEDLERLARETLQMKWYKNYIEGHRKIPNDKSDNFFLE